MSQNKPWAAYSWNSLTTSFPKKGQRVLAWCATKKGTMAYYCIAIYCGQGSRKTGDPGVWKWAWHHGGVQSDGRPDRIPYVRYWRHLPPAPELPQKAEVSIKNSPKSLKFAPKSDENEKVDP